RCIRHQSDPLPVMRLAVNRVWSSKGEREVGKRHGLAGEATSLAAVNRAEMGELPIDDLDRAALALPDPAATRQRDARRARRVEQRALLRSPRKALLRSEEHTSELQSRFDLVCRLLLEKKKYNKQ